MSGRVASFADVILSILLRDARRRLSEAGIEAADIEARLLVEHFTGTTRTDAVMRPETVVAPAAQAAVEAALVRRLAGEPVHRIIGRREFYGLDLTLSPGTLEPRPDTETLVDAMLPIVRECVARKGGCCILDLGTGTGAIALALLSQVDKALATGVDICDDALETAAGNARRLGLGDRFMPLRSDWFANIFGQYDAIASNPPYIPTKHIDSLHADVRNFDPRSALDGGDDGLEAYRVISDGAAARLAAGGTIGVEIGYDQKDAVTDIFRQAGYRLTQAVRDLAGNDRVLVFQKSSPQVA